MTTESKSEKTEKPEPKKKTDGESPKSASKATKSAASKSADSGKPVAGYGLLMRDWVPVPCEDGPVEVDPSKLLCIFDVRTEIQPIDEFVKTCATGIETPIKCTRMRYVGPDGDFAVNPDPKARVTLKSNSEYTVIVYGRRRTRAAIKLGFKTIRADLKAYKQWSDMLRDAYNENEARAAMTTTDRAHHIKNLKDGGLKQEDIATQLNLSAGLISQYLGLFDLPEAIQKMVGKGEITVTWVRMIRPLINYDHDEITALAARAVEKGWTEKEFKEAIAAFVARKEQTAEGKKGKGKGKKVARVTDFDSAEIKPPGVKTFRPLLTFVATKVKIERAKQVDETKPEDVLKHAKKVAHMEGWLKGLRQGAGLEAPPDAAFVTDEEEASA